MKRWCDERPTTSLEERAQSLLGRVGPSEALPRERLEATWAILQSRTPSTSPAGLAKGIGASVLGGTFLVAAFVLLGRGTGVRPAAPGSSDLGPPPPRAGVRSEPTQGAVQRPEGSPTPGAQRRVGSALAPTKRSASPSVPEDPLLVESRLIRRAVEQLRTQRDPEGALTTLDGYVREFTTGALREEATLLRLEALVASDQPESAVALLESMDFGRAPRAPELRLTHAELSARLGRCREAIDSFEVALRTLHATELLERALFGRAMCFGKLGNPVRQAQGLDEYLQRFPTGRFAGSARATLGDLPTNQWESMGGTGELGGD